MVRTKSLAALLIGTALISLPAFSQEGNRSEASVSFFGSYLKGTDHDGVRQTSTNSGGVLANYRFFFTEHQGVEANYGYTRNTVNYHFNGVPLGTNTNQNEVTGAYVFRMPMKRITPFVQAGLGALISSPRDFPTADRQGRFTFVYGGGADINLAKHIFVRAQYRGLVFNTPTFDLDANRGADRVTNLAEPTIGFGVKF